MIVECIAAITVWGFGKWVYRKIFYKRVRMKKGDNKIEFDASRNTVQTLLDAGRDFA